MNTASIQTIAVVWLALQFHIMDVVGFNLSLSIDYPEGESS